MFFQTDTWVLVCINDKIRFKRLPHAAKAEISRIYAETIALFSRIFS